MPSCYWLNQSKAACIILLRIYSTPTSSRAAVQAGSAGGNMHANILRSFRRQNESEWDYYSQGDETKRCSMLKASIHALTSIVFQLSEGNDA